MSQAVTQSLGLTALTDPFGRRIDYLRVSITDRCNLRCQYCMPATGMRFAQRSGVLTAEDFGWVAAVASLVGVRHLRVTGGEPLTRPDAAEIVRLLKRVKGIESVSMTSNGALLAEHAEALAGAGLDRLNISIDSLRPERFAQVTRTGTLASVWEGVRAAASAGIKLKLNAVVLGGFNDDEVDDWVRLAEELDLTVRFLELMPVGEGARLAKLGRFADLEAIRGRLCGAYGLTPLEGVQGNGPARYWALPGGSGRLGFITPMSRSYCDTCNRMRLTCEGELRACLASDAYVSAAGAIKTRDAGALLEALWEAAAGKPAGHRWRDGEVTRDGMSSLGG
jgi:GTP 3',8-cyclase